MLLVLGMNFFKKLYKSKEKTVIALKKRETTSTADVCISYILTLIPVKMYYSAFMVTNNIQGYAIK